MWLYNQDDDSDLDFELEAVPSRIHPVSAEDTLEVASCVKVWLYDTVFSMIIDFIFYDCLHIQNFHEKIQLYEPSMKSCGCLVFIIIIFLCFLRTLAYRFIMIVLCCPYCFM